MQSGYDENKSGKVINGGPMMGKALSTIEVPGVKGSSGILVMPEQESRRMKEVNCIRCSRCASACPMGLEPYLLATMSSLSMIESVENERIMDCIECGSCQYTCPSGRQLLDYIRVGKGAVGKMIRARSAK
jgi:electron transport complex protein RnfC